MKRYIRSDASTMSTSKMVGLRKTVNNLIYHCYIANNNYLKNMIVDDFELSDEPGDYPEFVFNHRHNYFDDYVIEKINTMNKDLRGVKVTDTDRDYMLNYYQDLTQADYNRNLYLKRDAAAMKK